MGVEPVYLQSELQGKKLVLSAQGDWISAHASEIEPQVESALRQHTRAERVEIDASAVKRIDTIGAWLFERLKRNWESDGAKAAITGLDPRYKVLLDEVAASNREPPKPQKHEAPIADTLAYIGQSAAEGWVDLKALVRRTDGGGAPAAGGGSAASVDWRPLATGVSQRPHATRFDASMAACRFRLRKASTRNRKVARANAIHMGRAPREDRPIMRYAPATMPRRIGGVDPPPPPRPLIAGAAIAQRRNSR